MQLQKFANNAAGTTTTPLSVGGTTFTLQSGDGAKFPVITAGTHCYVRLGTDVLNEVVKVTGRTGDVFTCVATTLAWAAGVPCILTASKEMFEGLAQDTDVLLLGMALARMRGLGDGDSGVFTKTGDLTEDGLKVVPQDSPNMSVRVNPGACIVLGVFTGTTIAVDIAITAPDTDPRITIIQIDQLGVITKKDGAEDASPVAPAPDAGNYEFASILVSPTHTDIDGGDITDGRNPI